jgi:CSLREA domain-containing protein
LPGLAGDAISPRRNEEKIMKRAIPSFKSSNRGFTIPGGVLLSLVVVLLMGAPSSASAATFTVNSTVDSVDAAPGDGTCADSLGRCTLRAAIMESNASGVPNTINVPAGTFTLTLGPADDEFNFDGAEDSFGDLDILNTDLTIIGAGPGATIIDGGGIDRVFDVNNFSNFGAPVNATFQGLTIRNGNAITTPEGFHKPGGGIQFDGTDNNTGLPVGTLTITNCQITSNTASGIGGGVLAIFGSLIMDGSEVSSNASVNASGGGVLFDGGSSAGTRTMQVTNSRIFGNTANANTFGSGGGIWGGGNALKTINYNVITNNTAKVQGGGVFNGDGSLTLNFNVIVGNTATNDGSSNGFRNNSGTTTIDNDWWGCNQGPSTSPCDRASGPAGFGITQWLTLSHTATPNSIQINQSTTLQADFFTNNLGSTIAPTDLVALNGRAVTFNNAVLGTITGAGTQISSGKANATFTAGSVGGSGSADATVDHATVTATISINQASMVTTNPSDQTVCAGASVSFTAAASGFPTPTVQWQVSSGGPFTNIPGATSTTLTFTATAGQNGNQYRAVFTNSTGSATTTAATLTVNTAPTVTTNPSNVVVCDGALATFTAAASGSPAPTVQWQVSSGGPFTNIPGATNTTLSFTATTAQSGNSYRAVFTNTCGTATTTAATLTVNASTATTDPADQTVCQGATASFSTTASGTGPFHYAWTVDGSAFGGDTSSISVPTGSLTVGSHTVAVTTTGACGSASQSATLTVNANTATSDPTDQAVCQGATASFSTTASGTGPFHYAWTVDGSAFGGDTSSISVPTGSLTVGSHTVAVTTTGTCGSASQSATLTVNANTTTSDPTDQTVCQGATASFSTTASGTGPFHYAWTVDGSAFGGDTSSISVPTGSLTVGSHTVAVTTTGTCGSASQSATLTVNANTATSDPTDQTVCQGATASFSTTASGTGPFHYAWTVDGSAFGGDTSSISVPTGSLTVGNHTVAVTTTGACGSASQSATLTVNANTATSDPADQTVCQGATASFSTTASGTGPFHYAWTVDGSAFGGDTSSISVPTGSLTVGSHTVAVTTTGTCGSASQSATLTVNANTATSDPTDQTVCQGATASFSTTASGTGPFHYAWTVDGSAFGGDTSSISVPTGSLTVGNHTVAVTTTGACGSASQSATLTVNANTTTTDPPDRTVCVGSTTSFTTSASGTGPFTFVWKKGATVLNTGDFGGRVTITTVSNTSTLTITNVQAGDAATYSVAATGACSTATQSANLTINSTPPGIVLNGNNIELWPPNHSYHTINVTDLVASASSCDGTVNLNSVVIDFVTSDEAENGNGDGNTNNDIVISCNRKSVQLRAERDGGGDGRVYTIHFKVTDSFGNVGTATAIVSVPKSQNGTAATDSGVHYTVTNATCP